MNRILELVALASSRLRPSGLASYALYSGEQGRAWVGAGRLALWLGGDPAGHVRGTRVSDLDAFFAELARARGPLFFLIGPPRGGSGIGEASAVAIEPEQELRFSAEGVESTVGEAGDLVAELRKLATSHAERHGEMAPFAGTAGTMAGWSGDTDEQYRARLAAAIALTLGQKGKAIVTRRYQRAARGRDPLDLFAKLALLEPNAAALHYAELPGQWVSLGTSPENVVESEAGSLLLDAVAGTRMRHADPARDAELYSELCGDAKEAREHAMAVERAESFAASVCLPGSVRVAYSRNVRRLRAVQHLHSRVQGSLEPGVRFAELMQRCHPPLSSYPEDLARRIEPPWPGRFYGGMLGRLEGPRQGMSFLNLRCLELEQGELSTYAGVGVVDGSSVDAELEEVLAKLATVRDAVELWLAESAERG